MTACSVCVFGPGVCPALPMRKTNPLPNAGDRVNNRCTHLVKGSRRWEFEKDMIM